MSANDPTRTSSEWCDVLGRALLSRFPRGTKKTPQMTVLPAIAIAAALASMPTFVHAGEIDTEHLFGFAIGTDIGEVGEKEIESETSGRFGKRTGSYAALSQKLEAEFTPAKNFRLSLGGAGTYHSIAGVNGFEDRSRGSFEALSIDTRYRFLDRAHSTFGLAIDAEPYWGRTDTTSGEQVNQYGLNLSLAIDKELVPNRIVIGLNLLYEAELTRSRVTGVLSREATIGIATALMAQVHPGIFVGAEARYLRTYEGLGLNTFDGHAVFFGPSLFAKLSENWWIAAAWSVQVAGRAADEPASLDLANFERHQVKFKFGFTY